MPVQLGGNQFLPPGGGGGIVGGNPFRGGPQGIAEILPLLVQMQQMQGGGNHATLGGGPQSMNGGGLQGGPPMQAPMQVGGGMVLGQPPQSMHGNPVPQPGMGPPPRPGAAPLRANFTQPSMQGGPMQAPAYAGGLAQRLQAQRQGRVSRPGAAPPAGGGGISGTGPPRGTVIPRPRGPQDSQTGRKVPQMDAPPFNPGGGSPGGGNAWSLKKR